MKQMSDRAPVRQQGVRRDSSPPEHSKIVLLAFVYLHYFNAVMSYVCLNLLFSVIAICVDVLAISKYYELLCYLASLGILRFTASDHLSYADPT